MNVDIDKLNDIAKPMSKKSIDLAKERNENRGWWNLSLKISITIRKVLREHDVSFEKFAEMLDVPLDQIMEWFGGKYNFDLKTIAKIDKKLKEIIGIK